MKVARERHKCEYTLLGKIVKLWNRWQNQTEYPGDWVPLFIHRTDIIWTVKMRASLPCSTTVAQSSPRRVTSWRVQSPWPIQSSSSQLKLLSRGPVVSSWFNFSPSQWYLKYSWDVASNYFINITLPLLEKERSWVGSRGMLLLMIWRVTIQCDVIFYFCRWISGLWGSWW